MLNTVQLINALSIAAVSVPINVIDIQEGCNDIINFQPIPKELIAELIFGPPEQEFPDSVKLEELQDGTKRLLDSIDGDNFDSD